MNDLINQEELKNQMREMVKHILPKELKEEEDIVENYTDTFVMIAEEYAAHQVLENIKD